MSPHPVKNTTFQNIVTRFSNPTYHPIRLGSWITLDEIFLFFVFLGTLLLRTLVYYNHTVFVPDEAIYIREAEGLLKGYTAPYNGWHLFFHFPPGTAFVIALFSLVTHSVEWGFQWMNILAGSIVVFPLFYIVKRLTHNTFVGLLAAIWISSYPYYAYDTPFFNSNSEYIYLCVFLTGCYFTIRFYESLSPKWLDQETEDPKHPWAYLCAMSILLAIAALIRIEALVWAVLFIPLILCKGKRRWWRLLGIYLLIFVVIYGTYVLYLRINLGVWTLSGKDYITHSIAKNRVLDKLYEGKAFDRLLTLNEEHTMHKAFSEKPSFSLMQAYLDDPYFTGQLIWFNVDNYIDFFLDFTPPFILVLFFFSLLIGLLFYRPPTLILLLWFYIPAHFFLGVLFIPRYMFSIYLVLGVLAAFGLGWALYYIKWKSVPYILAAVMWLGFAGWSMMYIFPRIELEHENKERIQAFMDVCDRMIPDRASFLSSQPEVMTYMLDHTFYIFPLADWSAIKDYMTYHNIRYIITCKEFLINMPRMDFNVSKSDLHRDCTLLYSDRTPASATNKYYLYRCPAFQE